MSLGKFALQIVCQAPFSKMLRTNLHSKQRSTSALPLGFRLELGRAMAFCGGVARRRSCRALKP